MRKSLLIALALFAGPATAQDTPDAADTGKPPIATAYPNLVYTHDQMVDVFVNPSATADKPAPVLVYFHGGAWARGERPKAASSFGSFIKMGFSVVSVDYRLTAQATAPAAVTDALCALSWTKANAARYHFDASRIVAYGTSAGGHLALMAGLLPSSTHLADAACGPLPKTAAILDYYGPTDLVPGVTAPKPWASLLNWIGPVKDPAALAKEMSPMTYVQKGAPPVFIVHGTDDPTVPYAQSTLLHEALTSASVPTQFHTVQGGVHGKFSNEDKARINADLKAFLTAQHILP
ncbi:MAG: alpha/beta hydrolase [Asticcacaulis sp.]